MKTQWTKRIGMLILAIAMLLGSLALVSCGDKDGSKDPSQTTAANPSGNPEETDAPMTGEELEFLPEDKNYKNYDFVLAAPKGGQDIYGTGHYCHLEGAEDVINRALHERELLMQDKFGIVMSLDASRAMADIQANLAKLFKSESAPADLVFNTSQNEFLAAVAGQIWNLNILDELNLEASYYDQRIQQNFRIGDALFMITGDYEVLDELVTFGVLYNDKVYKDLLYYENEDYGSPYQMVRDYKWTYSAMMEMAANYTLDNDGVEGMSQTDRWGIVSEGQAVYYMFLGSGFIPMANQDGELSMNLQDGTYYDNVVTILQDLLNFSINENVLLAADIKGAEGKTNFDVASDIFEENRALFRHTSLSDALYCAEMESDFGILPVPMYDAAQKAYYSMVNANAAWPLTIPYFVKDIERTATVVEALSYYSRYGGDESLYEAFFERLSLAKICRKPDDRAMLIMIFNNKVYDVDQVFPGAMSLHTTIASMANNKKGSDGLTGTIDSKLESVSKTIPGYYDMMIMQAENQKK